MLPRKQGGGCGGLSNETGTAAALGQSLTGPGRGADRTKMDTRPKNSANHRRVLAMSGIIILVAGVLILAADIWMSRQAKVETPDGDRPTAPKPFSRLLKPAEAAAVLGAEPPAPKQTSWHPPHVVKVWLTNYRGHTYRITQIPRCEHVETVIAYNPSGETLQQAKKRLGGMAASTGSFHNPKSMALADFLQSKGSIVSPARTGRAFVAIDKHGGVDISGDYEKVKADPGASAIALGQRLVPLARDGFTVAFMNRITDRMAVGLNTNYIFIVQSKTSIWRLSEFLRTQLPVTTAINCDGGHVVRGKGPVHLVFRWRKN